MTLLALQLIGVYLAGGVAFAVVFVTLGAGRLDSAARGTSIAFRALLIPGAAALWPALLVRWIRAERHTKTEARP